MIAGLKADEPSHRLFDCIQTREANKVLGRKRRSILPRPKEAESLVIKTL
jgi:hypothetical protein